MAHHRRAFGVAFVELLLLAAPTRAQEGNTMALGVNFTARAADAATAHGSRGIGLSCRLGHSGTGWGWSTGLGWFSADIDQVVGGATAEVGELRVRPFLGGYGYTYSFGRTAISADLLGGYAFVSFQQTPAAADVYRDRLGARAVALHASNTPVLKPQVNLWIDVAKKRGVNLSAGYAVARPRLTIRSSLGEQAKRLHAGLVT